MMEKAIERQRVVLQHLKLSFTSSSLENIDSYISASVCLAGDSAAYQRTSVFGDDIFVIVAAYRTPLCKEKGGGFKDTYPDDILAAVLKALIEETNVNPSEEGDIIVGSVLASGSQRDGYWVLVCLMGYAGIGLCNLVFQHSILGFTVRAYKGLLNDEAF